MFFVIDTESVDELINVEDDTCNLPKSEYTSNTSILNYKDISTQVNFKNVKSVRTKKIQCNLPVINKKYKSIALSPIKENISHKTISNNTFVNKNIYCTSEFSDDVSEASNNSILSSIIESENSYHIEYSNEKFKQLSYEITLNHIKNNPKSYIGLNEKWFKCNFIQLLSSQLELDERSIYITLMKIKLNDSFRRLGDFFGISESLVCRLFHNALPKLSSCFKELVYWPEEKSIKSLLPIPFRYRYSSVQSIIDCLEIEIPKPSDPIKQALTWSEYKKCNTLKYLISSTPDGLINYISEGFNGRCSDVLLVENSNFLNIIPKNSSVMADRGFKSIDTLLNKKNCNLIRPPSVSQYTKLTKDDVLETKRIASLRIHIERVIGRLREFETLKPHALINCQLVCNTDEIITIACGLINLQQPIIKQ